MIWRNSRPENSEKKAEMVAATPWVGLGNPVEVAAITAELQLAGISVVSEYPQGLMVKVGSEFHIRMTASTDRTVQYAQNSVTERESLKTKPLLWELGNFIKDMLQKYPEAQFLLTPQNMLGELATEVELNGRKFTVIMVLPDAMGKLSPHREPSKKQRKIAYLVWNEHAYAVLKEKWELDVQLIKPVDPLQAFPKLNEKVAKYLGLPEIFEKELLCVIKLSGSGGDPKLIHDIVSALWKNSKIESMIFPGKKRTGINLKIREWLHNHQKNPNKTDLPKMKWSLDEGAFYHVAREMNHAEQLLLTYPSEQFKHTMVLAELGKNPRIVWLPPRGDHEVLNLVHYLYLVKEQNTATTICIPKQYQADLQKKLAEYGFIPNVYYQMIEPDQLKKEHFFTAPSWQEKQIHLPASQAVTNIMDRDR